MIHSTLKNRNIILLPVDEGALPRRVVPDEHDGDLLPGREQLEPEPGRRLDEAVGRVRVEPVAVLEDALVDGGRGQVHRGGGGDAAVAADAARHV